MSATSVGRIGLDLVVNQKGYNKQMSGIQSLASKAGKALAGAFAVKKVVEFSKECINLGSDLQEVQNVVDVTFPTMSKKVDEFAKGAAASFGLSETMAKKFTGTFGSMAKAFGFSEQQAYEMGSSLTGLAGDVASFYNLSQDEAYTKLKSVFTGETESLKDLGVVMTQTALDSYALANGFGKTTKSMSEAEKVALRYSFVQDQLSAAAGDFSRTSGGWANQVRVLNLQFESLKATLGQGLISAFTQVLKLINILLGKVQVLATAFKDMMEALFGKQSTETSNIADVAQEVSQATADTAASTEEITNNLNKANRFLAKFDVINKVSDTSSNLDTGNKTNTTSTEMSFGESTELKENATELENRFSRLFDTIEKKCEPATKAVKKLYNQGFKKLKNYTWENLKGFWENFLKPLGEWTIGEGFPKFVNGLNTFLNDIDWKKINKNLNELWKSLEPLAENAGEGVLWFWEEVLVPFGTWAVNEVVSRFLSGLATRIEIINNVIELAKPMLNWLWEKFLEPLSKWAADEFLKEFDKMEKEVNDFAWLMEELVKLKEIDFKATFKGFIDKTFTAAKDLYDSINNSEAVKKIKAKLSPLWEKAKRAWDKIQNTEAKKKLDATLSSNFKKFKETWDALKDKTLSIKADVTAAITNIKELINKKIIAKLNKAIVTLNKLPGIEVPEIPLLAQGGYVAKNTPQLAVVGDNRHQGEIVAPEDKMLEMAKQAAALAGGNRDAEIISLLKQILQLLSTLDLSAKIDVNALKQLIVRLINDHTKATGVCEIIT